MSGASAKDIKLRIKSVKSTMQITKAMELVASSKLKRAKEKMERTRPYFEVLNKTLDDIAYNNKDFSSPYMQEREAKKICFVVIAGDRGLAGGFNNNLFKKILDFAGDTPYCVLPVGKKAYEFFARRNVEIISGDYLIAEDVSIADCSDIGMLVSKAYKEEKFDRLYVAYTRFVSVLSQTPVLDEVLPFVCREREENHSRELVIYEGDAESVFNTIVPQCVSGLIYGAPADSQAAEFAARRTAMESANKNAGEMIDALNLEYNRARQGIITQEITEIVSGAEAL